MEGEMSWSGMRISRALTQRYRPPALRQLEARKDIPSGIIMIVAAPIPLNGPDRNEALKTSLHRDSG